MLQDIKFWLYGKSYPSFTSASLEGFYSNFSFIRQKFYNAINVNIQYFKDQTNRQKRKTLMAIQRIK